MLKFLTSDICLGHNSGRNHPENAYRLINIVKFLKTGSYQIKTENINQMNKKLYKLIQSVHTPNLIQQLRNTQFKKFTFIDSDSNANSKTFLSSINAVQVVINSALQSHWNLSHFAIVRPPGHHTTPNKMMGFCYLNNIAIGVQPFLANNNRIAILDFDFHYGNGTADIFWNSPQVLYISIHADPTVNFPSQGFIDEIGGNEGKGFNIPIPLSHGSGDVELIFAIKNIILPILDEFKPTILGISAGFDGYANDPIGNGFIQFTPKGFRQLGQLICDFGVSKKIPIFHTLEGGYNLSMLPKLIYHYVTPWLASQRDPNYQTNDFKIKTKEIKTFKLINQILRPYWNY